MIAIEKLGNDVGTIFFDQCERIDTPEATGNIMLDVCRKRAAVAAGEPIELANTFGDSPILREAKRRKALDDETKKRTSPPYVDDLIQPLLRDPILAECKKRARAAAAAR